MYGFQSIEKLGSALSQFWFDIITESIPKDCVISSIVLTGDTENACLCDFEIVTDAGEFSFCTGYPEITTVDGTQLEFPDSLDECFDIEQLSHVASVLAPIVGEESDDLSETQLMCDIVSMFRESMNYEMLIALGDLQQKLTSSGFALTSPFVNGIKRHDDSTIIDLKYYVNGPVYMDFSSSSVSLEYVKDVYAHAVYESCQRIDWFSKGIFFVVPYYK